MVDEEAAFLARGASQESVRPHWVDWDGLQRLADR